MPKNKEDGMPIWLKNILWLIGTAGLIFAGVMRVYLNPISEKIKQIEVSTAAQIKNHVANDSFRFNALETSMKDFKNDNKTERKETNKRLRAIETTTATILEKINSLKRGK